jgi:uncharacterized membrane protein
MPRLLTGVVVLAILCGVFFRFYNIDKKVYWDDEIYTSLHVLGSTEAEWVQRSYHIVDAVGLRTLLHPTRDDPPKTARDTIRALAVEDPEHAPLYYVVAHSWVDAFGTSIAATRILSAIAGLFALPAAYWVGIELFEATYPAWLCVALVALSPVLVLYSQEAREYSFWSVILLLTWATFLRAQRLGSTPAWTLYGAVLIVALYVYPTAALIALGGLAYLVVLGEPPRTLVRPALASGFALLCFVPWLYVMLSGLAQIHRAAATVIATHNSAAETLRLFLSNLRHDYLDFDLVQSTLANLATSLPFILLASYTVYFVCTRAPRRIWAFLVLMLVSTVAPFVVLDLLSGGSTTRNARYFFPLYLDLDLALAYLISVNLSAGARTRSVWQAVFLAVLAGRFASIAASSQAETWWNKLNERSISVARAIDETKRPLLVSDNYVGWALSLSNYLAPSVRVAIRPRCYLCHADAAAPVPLDDIAVTGRVSDLFLLGPSKQLQARADSALGRLPPPRPLNHCIDVRDDCASALRLW